MIVILDSNVICQDFHMLGTSFRIFFNGLDAIPARLKVPEVVIDEVVNHYGESLSEAIKNLEKARDAFNRLSGSETVKPTTFPNFVNTKQYRKYLVEKIRNVGGEILTYPKISHKDVVARDLSRKKPFTREGKGYRDYLIWESVRSETLSGDKLVVFISNDTSGFAHDSKIDPELNKTLGHGTDFHLCTHLKQFNEQYVESKLKMLDGVKEKLEKNNLAGFDLKLWLKKELLGLIKNESCYELALFSWPEGSADVWPSEIVKYSNVVVESVQELKSGDKILKITINAKVGFTVTVDWEQYEKHQEIREWIKDSEPFSSAFWRTVEDVKFKISIILNSQQNTPISQNIDVYEGPGFAIENL